MRLRAGFGALAERDFRLLWLARTLSGIGDAIVPVAVSFAVLEIGSASDLGIVLGAHMAARMLFVVVGGVWADRLPRRAIMIGADVVRAAVQAVIALSFLTNAIEVWQLAVSQAVFGMASAFFGPASTGLVPQIVTASRLQEANALLGLSRNAIEVFGPAVSGLLVATVGYSLIFAIDAASFVASLACLAAMKRQLAPVRIAQSFLADARDGLREVARRSWLRVTLSADAVANFAMAPYFVLVPLVVREHLGGASDWGLMMTAAAVGGLAGGALVLRCKPARPLVPAYLVLLALPVALVTLVPPLPLPLLMAGSALFTLSIVVGNTFWQTMEQQHVPNEALGRVDSISWMMSLVIMPIGYVVTGPVADAIGVRETLVLAAALAAASSLGALAFPSVRELRRLEDDLDAKPSPSPAASAAGESPAPAPPAPLP